MRLVTGYHTQRTVPHPHFVCRSCHPRLSKVPLRRGPSCFPPSPWTRGLLPPPGSCEHAAVSMGCAHLWSLPVGSRTCLAADRPSECPSARPLPAPVDSPLPSSAAGLSAEGGNTTQPSVSCGGAGSRPCSKAALKRAGAVGAWCPGRWPSGRGGGRRGVGGGCVCRGPGGMLWHPASGSCVLCAADRACGPAARRAQAQCRWV